MKNKTYAEQEKKEVTDWNKVLDRWASYSPEGKEKWIAIAFDWVTCACGNQCAKIPRDDTGMPLDAELINVGADFYANIKNGHITTAKETLRRIEIRSQQILEEL